VENTEFCPEMGQKLPIAKVLPGLNLHLTKRRLNDAPRLCEMLRRLFDPRSIEREKLELSWALVDEYK
jgi:hypothetical protein